MPGTLWDVVDLVDPGLFRDHRRAVMLRAGAVFAVFVLVAGGLYFFAANADRRRRVADQALREHNVLLEKRVAARTRELSRMNEMLSEALRSGARAVPHTGGGPAAPISFQGGPAVTVDWYLETDELQFTGAFTSLFAGAPPLSTAQWLAMLAPESREDFAEALHRLRTGEVDDGDYDLVPAEPVGCGVVRVNFLLVREENGRPSRVVGAMQCADPPEQ